MADTPNCWLALPLPLGLPTMYIRTIMHKMIAHGVAQTTGWDISQLATGSYLVIFTNETESIPKNL